MAAMVADECCGLKSWTYSSKPRANVELDRNMESPVGVLFVITDLRLNIGGMLKEEAEVNVSFLISQRPGDKKYSEVDDTILRQTKDIAVDFISRVLSDKSLQIDGEFVEMKAVFDRSDSVRSGYNISMTIKERQGECIDGYNTSSIDCPEPGTDPIQGDTPVGGLGYYPMK